MIAASPNVTLVSLAEPEGHPIHFGTFARYGSRSPSPTITPATI